MADHPPEVLPHQQPVDEVLAALHTDAQLGLSEAEAGARLERYGRNELMADAQCRRGGNFLGNFRTVLMAP